LINALACKLFNQPGHPKGCHKQHLGFFVIYFLTLVAKLGNISDCVVPDFTSPKLWAKIM
jgi:hypothetical protein